MCNWVLHTNLSHLTLPRRQGWMEPWCKWLKEELIKECPKTLTWTSRLGTTSSTFFLSQKRPMELSIQAEEVEHWFLSFLFLNLHLIKLFILLFQFILRFLPQFVDPLAHSLLNFVSPLQYPSWTYFSICLKNLVSIPFSSLFFKRSTASNFICRLIFCSWTLLSKDGPFLCFHSLMNYCYSS